MRVGHYIPNALVDWYALCKLWFIIEASQTFERLCDKSTVSWNALILGYASQGNSKEIFSLLERMEHEGLEANDNLYLLRWNILYTICIVPLATLIVIPMEDILYENLRVGQRFNQIENTLLSR